MGHDAMVVHSEYSMVIVDYDEMRNSDSLFQKEPDIAAPHYSEYILLSPRYGLRLLDRHASSLLRDARPFERLLPDTLLDLFVQTVGRAGVLFQQSEESTSAGRRLVDGQLGDVGACLVGRAHGGICEAEQWAQWADHELGHHLEHGRRVDTERTGVTEVAGVDGHSSDFGELGILEGSQ